MPFQSKMPRGWWKIKKRVQQEARTPCHAIPIKDTNKVLKNKNQIKIGGWNTRFCHSNQGPWIMVMALIHVSQLMFFEFYNIRWFHFWSIQRREKLFNNFWHASFVLLEKIFTFLTSLLRPMRQQLNGYVQRGVEEMTCLESALGPRMHITPIIFNA